LGDVIAANPDGATANDATTNADGSPSDAATDDDFGPCIDGGCGCLTVEDISPDTRGNGDQILVSPTAVFFMVDNYPPGSDPAVFSAPLDGLDGAPPTEISGPSVINSRSMAMGGGWLFFREQSASLDGITRVALNANDQTPVSYFPLHPPLPKAPGPLATDSAHLFFSGNADAICRIPFNNVGDASAINDPSNCGGPPFLVYDGGAYSYSPIAANESAVFIAFNGHIDSIQQGSGVTKRIVTQAGSGLGNMTDDNGALFWTTVYDAGAIWTTSDDGTGSPTQIVMMPANDDVAAPTITVDDAGVYWAPSNDSHVWGAKRDGTGQQLLGCDPNLSPIAAIVSDATYVYWLTTEGRVHRAKKNP
jgi:hypothetical protein